MAVNPILKFAVPVPPLGPTAAVLVAAFTPPNPPVEINKLPIDEVEPVVPTAPEVPFVVPPITTSGNRWPGQQSIIPAENPPPPPPVELPSCEPGDPAPDPPPPQTSANTWCTSGGTINPE